MLDTKNKSKKSIVNLMKSGLIMLSITLGLLLIIELVSRLIVYNQFKDYHTNLAIQGKSRWVNDSVLHWTNRPFFLEYNLSAQYNELGMRVEPGDVFMPQKEENDFWVFLFGGSAMAGMGSNQNGEWYGITGVNDHSIDKSIDGYLQKILQDQMPDKNVRVFNAAVSMHGVSQSFRRYKLLASYKPDWVISMDGVNDPSKLDENESIEMFLDKEWKSNPTQNEPLLRTFFLMSNSGLYYKLAKTKYHYLEDIRLKKKIELREETRKNWMEKKTEPIIFEIEQEQLVKNAVDTFMQTMEKFEAHLTEVGQRHLLLVQPYLALRKREYLKGTESAVYNYFSSHHNLPSKNRFFSLLYSKEKNKGGQPFLMHSVHSWKDWVFVDYCHFTASTNELIAKEIGEYIFKDGN